MKLFSVNTIKVEGDYLAPGTEFEIDDATAKELIASGAAARKMREVEDDEDTDGRESGANTARDPRKPLLKS